MPIFPYAGIAPDFIGREITPAYPDPEPDYFLEKTGVREGDGVSTGRGSITDIQVPSLVPPCDSALMPKF
jgi:hypothetical protein